MIEAILQVKESETVLTQSSPGKWARGINNKFIQDMQNHEKEWPDLPVQNMLTLDIRKSSGGREGNLITYLFGLGRALD